MPVDCDCAYLSSKREGLPLKEESTVSRPMPVSSKTLLKVWLKVDQQEHKVPAFFNSGVDAKFLDEELTR